MQRALVALLLLTTALSGCVHAIEGRLDTLSPERAVTQFQDDWAWTPIELDVELEQPMFQGDIQRTGWNPSVRVPDAVEAAWTITPWNIGEHSAAKGSAVRVGDTIYAGTDHGWLMAIDINGTVQWNTTIGGPPRGTHGTPLVHDGGVYIGNYHGYLHAVDATDGTKLWNVKLGGSVASSPLWYKDHIVVATETSRPSGILQVVHPDGHVVWADHDIANHPHSSVAIDPALDIAVVGANDGLLYAWNVSDITEPQRLWTFDAELDIKAPILIADGAAFFGSWSTNIYRVDLQNGTPDWTFDTPNYVMGGAAIHPDAGLIYIGGHDRTLHALDARTGEEIWSHRTGGRIIGQPAVTPNAVVFGSFDRHLYAVNPFDGQLIWKVKADGPVTSAPLVTDDLIVFADRSIDAPGGLYALRPTGVVVP